MRLISQLGAVSAGTWLSRFLTLAFLTIFTSLATLTPVDAETRQLKLFFLHTKEKATITYKKNGRYLPAGLKRVNTFLRDWRRNEPTRMDPELLDLIWEIYRQSGSSDYINVVSGYRSPATNSMLRKRGRGVAKRSQHTLGKAIDFFLPDVKLAKLRKIGLIEQLGGVGYYPSSGSPFIHIDTGSVRHWPRMSRKELVRVFPRGKTLHVPNDGKPLPGYNQAVALYNAKKSPGNKLAQAKGDEKQRKDFFARLASLSKSDDEDSRFSFPTRKKNNKAQQPVSIISNRQVQPQLKTVEDEPAEMPPLPEMANIPVPTISPRVRPQLIDDRQYKINNTNINVARLDGQIKLPMASLLPGATTAAQQQGNAFSGFQQPSYDIPTQALQPVISSTMVALGLPSHIEPTRIGVQSPGFNSNRLSRDVLPLAPITTGQLRQRLIAQANKQLIARPSDPPRPALALNSRFVVAFSTPQGDQLQQPDTQVVAALSGFDSQSPIEIGFNIPVAVPLKRPQLVADISNRALETLRRSMEKQTRQLASLSIGKISPGNKKSGKFPRSNSILIKPSQQLRAPAFANAAIRPTPISVLSARFSPFVDTPNSTNFAPEPLHLRSFTRID